MQSRGERGALTDAAGEQLAKSPLHTIFCKSALFDIVNLTPWFMYYDYIVCFVRILKIFIQISNSLRMRKKRPFWFGLGFFPADISGANTEQQILHHSVS